MERVKDALIMGLFVVMVLLGMFFAFRWAVWALVG